MAKRKHAHESRAAAVEVRAIEPFTHRRSEIAAGEKTTLRPDQAERLAARGIVEIIHTTED